jgi:hypothetical protein
LKAQIHVFTYVTPLVGHGLCTSLWRVLLLSHLCARLSSIPAALCNVI